MQDGHARVLTDFGSMARKQNGVGCLIGGAGLIAAALKSDFAAPWIALFCVGGAALMVLGGYYLMTDEKDEDRSPRSTFVRLRKGADGSKFDIADTEATGHDVGFDLEAEAEVKIRRSKFSNEE